MTREDRVRRGDMADVLQSNAILEGVLAGIEQEAMGAIRNSLHPESAVREAQYFRLKSVDDVRMALRKLVEDGQLAAREIAEARDLDQARKSTGLGPGDIP